jgi:uncharacterized protein
LHLVKIPGSTVLLTGATGGIGHAVARELHGRGARLILTGRRAEVLQGLAAEFDAQVLAADLADRAEVDRLLGEAGAVDILVANAGLPGSGLLEDHSIEELDRVLDVNLRAPIVLARALAPAMAARGGGHLLFVSSLSGRAASARSAMYCATKFGLRGFALALRTDLHGQHVGVSLVSPGFIRDAGMFADSGATLPPGVGTRTPHDVARAVAEAIERNRAEVDVAPLPLRAGAIFASVAPGLAAGATRMTGADRLADTVAAGQRDKR